MVEKSVRFIILMIKRLIWDIFVNRIFASSFIPDPLRSILYRMIGMVVLSFRVHPHCYFKNRKIFIGSGTFINYNCFFDTTALIHIGKSCDIAHHVKFYTATHEIGTPERRAGRGFGKPITIGDGVWIGANTTIIGGVTIGSGCLIAAGTVVTKDCLPDSLYAGVPAKLVRKLEC